MKPFLLVLVAIWVYPILALFVMLSLNEKPKARKAVLIVSATLAVVGMCGLLSGYSTVNENIDWFFITSIYLFISLIVWRIALYPNNWIKVLGFMFALLIFGYGYFNGSAGFMGIAFRMSEYDHGGKILLDENLSYTESILGNAKSGPRGKRIELFANPKNFTFLEHMILERTYTDIQQFSTPAKADFIKEENKIIFSIPPQRKGKYKLKGWSDTVDLNLYQPK